MFLSLKHFGSTSVIKCVNGLHRWRNVLLYSDILFILGIFFQLKHNNLFNNQWAEYIIWSPESCLWVTWLFFTSLGKLWQWALSLCWRSGSVWGISFILSSFCLFIFYFCCFFQSKTLFFFFFFGLSCLYTSWWFCRNRKFPSNMHHCLECSSLRL